MNSVIKSLNTLEIFILNIEIVENGSSENGEQSRQMSLSALCSNENNDISQINKRGISLDDYYKIFAVLTHIDDVDKVFSKKFMIELFLNLAMNLIMIYIIGVVFLQSLGGFN